MSLEQILIDIFEAEPPDPRDKATAELAQTYAREIDYDGDLVKLGPLLLAALEALQMSPRARAAAQRGMKPNAKSAGSRFDELRERRARKHRAEDLHAAGS